MRMKTKRIGEGKARVIRIDETAVQELLNETFMEHLGDYFDVLDETKVTLETSWDREKGEFVALVYDGHTAKSVDLDSIGEAVGLTTDSLFRKKRYETIDLSKQPGV